MIPAHSANLTSFDLLVFAVVAEIPTPVNISVVATVKRTILKKAPAHRFIDY